MDTVLSFLDGGLLKPSLLGYIGLTLLLTHVTIISVTVYLHRHQAHRALELHPVISHFFRCWLWLTTGMVTGEWVAVHRRHHARCETADDPHSPLQCGIRKVLWQGAELYKRAAADRQTLQKYGHGTPDDWLERHLYAGRRNLGLITMLIIDVLLLGVGGITVWAVQMLWIPFFAAGVINGLGHWWGYRNFEVSDRSTNIVPWGILIGGEELHNNHHTYAASAKLSVKRWEFDIGWLYIRALAALRLARIKKVAGRPVLDRYKAQIDMDTVRAVIQHRFQVMARYSREVVARVCREERARARGAGVEMLKRARHLVVRDDIMLDEQARHWLSQALERYQSLQTVYRFKRHLQRIWTESAASNELLLQALQDWCQQAEQTGIQALRDFAAGLRSYSLPASSATA
ncbi:MAG: transposase [Gammaproteobacteria bacterium]|nr:transposase [Gammaproteobacteria bacterium]